MSSKLFKKLGSFSEDCLHNQLKRQPLSEETKRELEQLEKSLSKPPAEELSTKREKHGEVFQRIAETIKQNVHKFGLSGEHSSQCNC